MTSIVINTNSAMPFPPHWKYCIGTGRLGLALQKEYLDHLAMVQQDIQFKYIRGHGLFHEDVGIYKEIETAEGIRPFYNFTYIDRIFDSFLALNLRPFVEFGFMPKALASGEDTVFYWEGNITPPKDYDKWRQLIKATVQHFVDRYGLEEVLQWPFEVWNEPNLVNFWKDADKEEYFHLYQETVLAVKEVHPDFLVGGPAICGGSDEWITDFLAFCAENQVPVDFISRHAYTSKPPKKKTQEYYYQELEPPQNMLDQFAEVRQLIDEAGHSALPFHITEYNSSYSPINPIHDTPFNAAYLAQILSEGGDHVDSFSYWTFSDVFEETDIPRAQFHGGFGLIALNSIPKPVYHLFSFFHQLGDTLLHREKQMIVTQKQDGSFVIAAWNPVTEKGDDFSKTISLQLPAAFEQAFVCRKSVNETHANPWRVWKEMGRPRFPGRQQVEVLQEAAKPLLTTTTLAGDNGVLQMDVTLSKNEVTMLEIRAREDESDTYDGLDDSLLTSY